MFSSTTLNQVKWIAGTTETTIDRYSKTRNFGKNSKGPPFYCSGIQSCKYYNKMKHVPVQNLTACLRRPVLLFLTFELQKH
jgi:hypothetical protein